ncbi:MAG: EamA family transporter [Polaromonas sp.]|uniref:EamA family transporter n=1 Tax=Polaromonas sp. TaxID=1869339 RepID=UPI0027306575|nr:EamA family transporter [Polaromonas sp.]MDP2452048.1 EamA family transporter [Polaromonas sp.]MDP3250244.1 EamA family transporter [Polaromonas sp.]MDP3756717.1 EamA family transporter [Polaromonas sp.]
MRPAVLTGRDLAAALVVVVVWGVNFVVMKFALRDFTPFQLGAARYVFAVLPLVLFVRPPNIPWKWLAFYGLFQGVGQFGILFVALKVGMTAALASVLLQTQVFFTALFGFVLLHERASRPLQAGMVLAALGLACFALNYLAPAAGGAVAATTLAGFVLTLGAAAMWAMSNIVARHVQQGGVAYSPMAFVVWSSIFAILPFTLLSLVFDPEATRWQWTQARASSWLAVAYLGWVATILGYSLWTGLLKRHPANRVAPFSLGVPVVGLTTGMLVLGEAITPWQWAGITLVAAALICVLSGNRWMAAKAD